MTGNHIIDQLTEWWNEATPGIPKKGDTYIEDERHLGRLFRIVEAPTDHKYGFDNIRILARAPKPEPAWHDAVAVMARTAGRSDRRVFIREDDGWWEDADCSYKADELAYVTPLIEAKVTDEMVERYWAAMRNPGSNYDEAVRHALAAALEAVAADIWDEGADAGETVGYGIARDNWAHRITNPYRASEEA